MGVKMNIKIVPLQFTGMAAVLALSSAVALGADNTVGKSEFEARCAMCHGATGKGDGWLGKGLIKPPPSIRELKKKNNGVFPLQSVTEIIDGRKAVSMHGPREMPVWGDVYRSEEKAASAARPGATTSDEQMARAKIRALANYVLQLQD